MTECPYMSGGILTNVLIGFKLLFYVSVLQHDSLSVELQKPLFITSVVGAFSRTSPISSCYILIRYHSSVLYLRP